MFIIPQRSSSISKMSTEFQPLVSPKPWVPSAVCGVVAATAITLVVGTTVLGAPKADHTTVLSSAPNTVVRSARQVPVSTAAQRLARPSTAVSARAAGAGPQEQAMAMPGVVSVEGLARRGLPSLWSSAIHSLVAVPIVMLMSALVWSRKSSRVAMATTTAEKTDVAEDEYTFATMLEEVPKGTRKLVRIKGANILIFWYRNELYAIENRSPAEGAFNQGFEQARFTQNYGILCPSTDTEFNMKTGEVTDWLPNNTVLRFLTPPCTPLEVFPVKMEEGEIKVAVPEGERAYFDGGATSSFERNNVFGLEPRMYLEDGTYIDDEGVTKSPVDPGTIVVTTLAVAIIAVAGTAVCLYAESIPALAAFWIVGFAIVGKQVLEYSDLGEEE